jgi:hypothetical protein
MAESLKQRPALLRAGAPDLLFCARSPVLLQQRGIEAF